MAVQPGQKSIPSTMYSDAPCIAIKNHRRLRSICPEMLGIVPAAGAASRLQPLGGSKELLPVGSRRDAAGLERPRAVAEYLLERMARAGADRVVMTIAPAKTDLIGYFGAAAADLPLSYVVQPRPAGLCDALFRAVPWVGGAEPVLIGLPDTIWFPENAFAAAPPAGIHLITFPVAAPEHFDAVIWDAGDGVARIEVKMPGPASRRIWGALVLPAADFLALFALWRHRGCRDQYLGHLLNAWIAQGRPVTASRTGTEYMDVGTLAGYRHAQQRMQGEMEQPAGGEGAAA